MNGIRGGDRSLLDARQLDVTFQTRTPPSQEPQSRRHRGRDGARAAADGTLRGMGHADHPATPAVSAAPAPEPFHRAAPGRPPVRGFLHRPASPARDWLVLTHGAGGNCSAKLLVALGVAFADAGLSVLRCDLPYRQARPKGPPSPSGAARDREGLRQAVSELRWILPGRVYLGGQSYGGRQASMLVAEEPGLADGLLLLSYPLHPPGRATELRTAHFPALRAPTVFAHGSQDPFGSLEELETGAGVDPRAHDAGRDRRSGPRARPWNARARARRGDDRADRRRLPLAGQRGGGAPSPLRSRRRRGARDDAVARRPWRAPGPHPRLRRRPRRVRADALPRAPVGRGETAASGDLAFHLFRSTLAFADGMDLGRLPSEWLAQTRPPDLQDGDAVARYGALVQGPGRGLVRGRRVRGVRARDRPLGRASVGPRPARADDRRTPPGP